MKLNFLPKTFSGRWSVRLVFLFFLLFGIFQLFVASGQRGGEKFFSNLLLGIPALLAAACGVSAFFVGVVGFIKGERSPIVFLSATIGLLVLLFCLAEIIFPH